MIKRIPKYYLYQTVGWGMFLLVPWTTGLGQMKEMLIRVISGLLISHLLRYIINSYGWLTLPLKKAWPRLLAVATVAGMVLGAISRIYGYLFARQVYEGLTPRFFLASMNDLLFIIGPWTMLYYFYHYAGRVSQAASRNRKLEMRVKEMEERSGIAGTDIDTMMESLQRIQTFIREDPARSREEITEFSKLLREGYLKTS